MSRATATSVEVRARYKFSRKKTRRLIENNAAKLEKEIESDSIPELGTF
jgi:hypothetical protein